MTKTNKNHHCIQSIYSSFQFDDAEIHLIHHQLIAPLCSHYFLPTMIFHLCFLELHQIDRYKKYFVHSSVFEISTMTKERALKKYKKYGQMEMTLIRRHFGLYC